MASRRVVAPLLAALVLACGAPTENAAQERAGEWVTWGEGFPTRPDSEVYDRADQRWKDVAAELVDWEDGDLSCTYVDTDAVVVVVAASDRGVALAEKAFAGAGDAVAIERGRYNHRQLMDFFDVAMERVDGLHEITHIWGNSHDCTGVDLVVNGPPTDAQREQLEAFAADHELPIWAWVMEGASFTFN